PLLLSAAVVLDLREDSRDLAVVFGLRDSTSEDQTSSSGGSGGRLLSSVTKTLDEDAHQSFSLSVDSTYRNEFHSVAGVVTTPVPTSPENASTRTGGYSSKQGHRSTRSFRGLRKLLAANRNRKQDNYQELPTTPAAEVGGSTSKNVLEQDDGASNYSQQTRSLVQQNTTSTTSSSPPEKSTRTPPPRRLVGRMVLAYILWVYILTLVAIFFIVLDFCSLGLDA
ncbi:unnamed protein product, partial [Amoebophrya sp. A25]